MDAEQPDLGVPRSPRFFCHRCNVDFEDASEDYKCPYCNSGFIEQLQTHSNNMDSMNIDEDDPTGGHPFNDLAFLMTAGRTRHGQRDSFLEQLFMGIGAAEGVPPGTVTAGTPFVLVGAPGDYVIGGEGLDAVVSQLLGQLEHSGPPPLAREVIASIPTEDASETHMANGNTCSVCWDTYNLGEKISRLICDHIFHKTCIDPWLNLHATCPICRRNLAPPGSTPPPREDEPVLTAGFVNIRTERTNPMSPPNETRPPRVGDDTITPDGPDRPFNPHRIRIPNPYMRTMYNPANWPAAMAHLAAANLTGTINNFVQGPNFIFNAQTGLNPNVAATVANATAGQTSNAQAGAVPNASAAQNTGAPGTNTIPGANATLGANAAPGTNAAPGPNVAPGTNAAPRGTNAAPGANAAGSNAPGNGQRTTPPRMELRRILRRVSMTPFYSWGTPSAAAGPSPPQPHYNTDIDYD